MHGRPDGAGSGCGGGLNYIEWRFARGLTGNKDPAGHSDCGRDKDDGWGFKVEDEIEVGIQRNSKQSSMEWHRGTVVAVFKKYILVQLANYRVTISKWDVKGSSIKLKRLSKKTR